MLALTIICQLETNPLTLVSLSSAKEIYGFYLRSVIEIEGLELSLRMGVEIVPRKLNEEAKEWSFLIQKMKQFH